MPEADPPPILDYATPRRDDQGAALWRAIAQGLWAVAFTLNSLAILSLVFFSVALLFAKMAQLPDAVLQIGAGAAAIVSVIAGVATGRRMEDKAAIHGIAIALGVAMACLTAGALAVIEEFPGLHLGQGDNALLWVTLWQQVAGALAMLTGAFAGRLARSG